MKKDRRGILSLPVKLTASFMLIAICISSISGIVPFAEEKITTSSVENVVDRIDKAITDIWCSENGDRLTVGITLPPGCSLEIHGDGQDAMIIDIMYYGEKSKTEYLAHAIHIQDGKLVLTDGCSLTVERTAYGVSAI